MVFISWAKTGTPCLVNNRALGPLLCIIDNLKQAAVSFASAGLNTLKLGIALKAIACSIGW